MAYFKYSPEQFLEINELNFIRDSADKFGFRKNILENSVLFGLIKSNADTSFANGRVTQDTDAGGLKTVQIAPLKGIDSAGNFLYSPNAIRQIPINSDSNWYWLRVQYLDSNLEAGTISIDTAGNLTGVGTKFLTTMRSGVFGTSIRFQNSVYNTQTYQVLQVISDTSAQLSNPSNITGTLSEFAVESNLTYASLGCTTAGVAIDPSLYYPFHHDSMQYSLIVEAVNNTRPAYTAGNQFYIARIKSDGSLIQIQDKRIEHWTTKASNQITDIDRTGVNNLIGVEQSVWAVPFSPADKNNVQIGWGLRSSAFSVNTNSNVLTISAGLGGRYKSVADYNAGDFIGWRVYTANGKFSKVLSSTASGGAILLQLDSVDIDNFSVDGGTTFISQTITVVPNAEEITILCTADVTDNVPSVTTEMTFPIFDGVGVIPLECYKATCLYSVQYKYKSFHEYTGLQLLPSDNTYGYLTEASFSSNGVLKPLLDQVRQTYTALGSGVGYITLQIAPFAFSVFQNEVFLGDKFGVNNITSLTSSVTYDLVVGTSYQTQRITGTQSIAADTTFNLNATARNGNVFYVVFNCTSLSLNGFNIYFKQSTTTLKKFTIADTYCMLK